MRLPSIIGHLDRRILANYRIDPSIAAAVLPKPFRPKLIRGFAIGGICLIRLRNMRPKIFPFPLGVTSENAAHRFAVEWDEGGTVREGVYVRRRDTDCLFNVCAGGRVFPGEHHHATFTVDENASQTRVALISKDGETRVSVAGHIAQALPADSVFADVNEASGFFEVGSLGYSATTQGDRFDGLEMQCHSWGVTPLAIERVESSYFDDRNRFPSGAIAFDHALIMHNIELTWHSRADLCCETGR